MELRQLEYLVAVAEEASFTRAAGRVHISQSGVSAQIRRLEHELGAALIDRSSRAARVTDAGAAALPHARAALSAAAALRQSVDEVNGLLTGRLVVGMVTACTVTGLFDALAGFRRAHPGVSLALVEDDSAALAGPCPWAPSPATRWCACRPAPASARRSTRPAPPRASPSTWPSRPARPARSRTWRRAASASPGC